MKRALAALLIGLCLITLAGPGTWGRLVLWTGLPGSGVLLSEPAARGLALYRAGAYEAADAAFAEAGRGQTFNRALTLAATGNHALSVAYFDAVLFVNPGDEEARRLRALVDGMVEKVRGDSVAPGRLAGHGGNTGQAEKSPWGLPGTPDPEWQRKITERGFAASEAWLETISDDPGEFLRVRLEKEYQRRAALGLIRAEEADPW
jgi:Ca-activated chloride channel family protein